MEDREKVGDGKEKSEKDNGEDKVPSLKLGSNTPRSVPQSENATDEEGRLKGEGGKSVQHDNHRLTPFDTTYPNLKEAECQQVSIPAFRKPNREGHRKGRSLQKRTTRPWAPG